MRVPELSIPEIGAKVAKEDNGVEFFYLFSACYFI